MTEKVKLHLSEENVNWTIARVDDPPFKTISLSRTVGETTYTTRVSSLDRKPENILYMLADDILKALGDKESEAFIK